MNARRFRAVARKEFLHVLRDKRSLIISLLLPAVMLLIFGYALSLDVDRIPTVVLDRDATPASRDFIARLAGSRYFQIAGYANGSSEIDSAIDRGQALLGVIILPGFGADVAGGNRAGVQLLLDGSDANTASIAKGYAESVVASFAREYREAAQNLKGAGRIVPPIDARVRVVYNDDLKSQNYIVPGLIAVVLMVIAAMLTSLTIAREWETGTMEQLISTPVRPVELLLGKLVAYFAIGVVNVIISLIFALMVFRVPFQGNPIELAIICAIFLFGVLCLGILISTLAKSQTLAYQFAMLTSFLPAFLLSGFIYAIENMPVVIQVISHIVPAKYFVTALKGIFLKGVGFRVLWLEVAMLSAYSLIVFVLAARKLRLKIT
jgi:ABC-2 type transport system permease protein